MNSLWINVSFLILTTLLTSINTHLISHFIKYSSPDSLLAAAEYRSGPNNLLMFKPNMRMKKKSDFGDFECCTLWFVSSFLENVDSLVWLRVTDNVPKTNHPWGDGLLRSNALLRPNSEESWTGPNVIILHVKYRSWWTGAETTVLTGSAKYDKREFENVCLVWWVIVSPPTFRM